MANKYNGDVTKDGTAVKMYDKSGNALSDGYSVNGTTYKANGERIDAGTTVAGNDGKMYTYNGEGKETTVHDPSTTSSKSSVSTSSSDYNTLVNQYANAQKQAQIAALQKQYQNTLNQIAAAEATTKENAKSSRDNLSVQNQLANSRLARAFANAGLTNSGTNAQAQINSAGALQNGLGSITAQENKALDDYQTQRNTAYSNLQSDIASVNANVDATALQQQLNYLQTMEQLALQQQYQKELIDYNNEYDNIWDDTVERYVPFSFYQTTHPTSTITSTGGTTKKTSGSGSKDTDDTADEVVVDTSATDTDKDENAFTNFFNNLFGKNKDTTNLESQVGTSTNSGSRLNKIYEAFTPVKDGYTRADSIAEKNENAKTVLNDVKNGELTSQDIQNNIIEYTKLVGYDNINQILEIAKQLGK